MITEDQIQKLNLTRFKTFTLRDLLFDLEQLETSRDLPVTITEETRLSRISDLKSRITTFIEEASNGTQK